MSHCRCPGVTASLVDQRAAPEMPRLKNCCACDIPSGSRGGTRTLKGAGGGGGEAQQAPKAQAF